MNTEPMGFEEPDPDDGPTSARETYDYPAGVALMHLDKPSGTLSAAQVAFLLRHDAEYIEELMNSDQEQADQWAADALAARRGEPDPLLVDASPSGTDGLVEVCLAEAREWEMGAQAKREALKYLRVHPQNPPEWSVAGAMDRVQAAAEAWSEQSWGCEADCDEPGPRCPDHRDSIRAANDHRDAAVDRMRNEFLAAFAAHQISARAESDKIRPIDEFLSD